MTTLGGIRDSKHGVENNVEIQDELSPIRSIIESGFGADKRSDVRLYYGARNLRRMAYQDRIKDWESSCVKVVPVLSQPDGTWAGESGFVQAAFAKAKNIFKPQGTGAVFCGQKQMTGDVKYLLVADGVSAYEMVLVWYLKSSKITALAVDLYNWQILNSETALFFTYDGQLLHDSMWTSC